MSLVSLISLAQATMGSFARKESSGGGTSSIRHGRWDKPTALGCRAPRWHCYTQLAVLHLPKAEKVKITGNNCTSKAPNEKQNCHAPLSSRLLACRLITVEFKLTASVQGEERKSLSFQPLLWQRLAPFDCLAAPLEWAKLEGWGYKGTQQLI